MKYENYETINSSVAQEMQMMRYVKGSDGKLIQDATQINTSLSRKSPKAAGPEPFSIIQKNYANGPSSQPEMGALAAVQMNANTTAAAMKSLR